jgi:hypothetical protein
MDTVVGAAITAMAIGLAGIVYALFHIADILDTWRVQWEEKNRWIKSKGPGSYSPSSDA